MSSFGDHLSQYCSRKHGLSQGQIADLADLAPSTVSRMCRGKRLTGRKARERVLRIIFAMYKEGVLQYCEEANALLTAAGQEPLGAGELAPVAAGIVQSRIDLDLTPVESQEIAYLYRNTAPVLDSPGHRPVHIRGRYLPHYASNQLLGLEPAVQQLIDLLFDPAGPHFISLVGLGGIGKTALARATATKLCKRNTWKDILWVSVRQQETMNQELNTSVIVHTRQEILDVLLMQLGLQSLLGTDAETKMDTLRAIMTQQPYLVVIDNLETFSEIETLVRTMRPLAGETRFLLTSRFRPHLPDTYVFEVQPLSPECARQLVENELESRGYPSLSAADQEQLYATSEGMPLALKMLAAQIGPTWDNPAPAVPPRSQSQDFQSLYNHLYQRAWDRLGRSAQHLLLTMFSLDPNGEDTSFIQAASQLEPADSEQGFLQLKGYSLLENAGRRAAPQYRLHRVTVAFLRQVVLQEKDWNVHYCDFLRQCLVWARRLVKECPPNELEPHFKSFSVLLHRAQAYNDLDLPAVELVLSLHPWPQRWGKLALGLTSTLIIA